MSVPLRSVSALLRFAGVTDAPEVDGAGLWWPSVRAGLVVSSTERSGSRQGWTVFRAPRDWDGWSRCVFAAAAAVAGGRAVQPDPAGCGAVAAHVLLRYWGCDEAPVAAASAGLSVAWLEHRVALVLPGELRSVSAVARLRQSGWSVFQMSGSWMADVAVVRSAALAVAAASSARGATNPSGTEQKMAVGLLDALLGAGCPAPRRDVEIADPDTGKVMSRPDFAWPEVSLVLEVDGWFHHSGRGLDVVFEAGSSEEARRLMRAADRSRFERDAIKRRKLALLGWVVLTCSDTEIDRDGCGRIASDVTSMYRRLSGRR